MNHSNKELENREEKEISKHAYSTPTLLVYGDVKKVTQDIGVGISIGIGLGL